MSDIPKGMPCRRDCPDRQPGCHCDLKKQWDAEKEAKKKMIHDAKEREYAVGQVRKQQLELDMEQQTGCLSRKEFVKVVYCHPAYLTSMQSTS